MVNDAMILIHLAKITLLETVCDFFEQAIIPEMVFGETVKTGKQKRYPDALLIKNMIKAGKIKVKKVNKKWLIKKANDFNIFGGEAEAAALYWQENADLIATDDDNVRNKKEVLEIKLIGTPAVILSLFRNKKIEAKKAESSINKLRKIGWFSSQVLDKVLMEVEKK